LVSWHDDGGKLHVEEVPRDAVCLAVGAHCPICYEAAADKMLCLERILAVGLEQVVCTGGVHPVPQLVVVLRDETRRAVAVIDTRSGAW
jgi:hypothetical protein